jgi:hypothetical protein
MRHPRISGFIGWRGENFQLRPLPDDHPVVLAHPDLFKPVEPDPAAKAAAVKPRRGRPRKTATVKPVEPVVVEPEPVEPVVVDDVVDD